MNKKTAVSLKSFNQRIKELNVGESVYTDDSNWHVTRVPGGWIWQQGTHVFVPDPDYERIVIVKNEGYGSLSIDLPHVTKIETI